ncbi:MAG: ABC transporter substrate-binding protein [Gammaproteobacteria bacterium]|nr:ABC transporter substrate-binding protein [Gammaproteobacteria bacterium]
MRSLLWLCLCWVPFSSFATSPVELRRIVSLSPAMTAMLHELGQEHRLVGVTRYCRQAPENQPKVSVVGGASDPEVESILSLQPDVVLASSLLPENIEKRFQALGIPVERFRQDRLQDIFDQVHWLGKHTASVDRAEQELVRARQLIQTARARNETTPPRTGLMVFSENMDLVAGGDTYPAEVMDLAGLSNVASVLPQSWPTISQEWLLDQDPDWILVATQKPDAEIGSYRERLLSQWSEHKVFSQLTSVKTGRIITISQSRLVVPSLQVFSVIESLRQEMQLLSAEGKVNHALD